MKTGTQFLAALLILLSYQCIAEPSQREIDFLKKYEVEESVKAIMDEHYKEIDDKLTKLKRYHITEHEVWTFPWLPGYFVKFNLDRIYGMEKMRRSMERQNLDLLGVPDKRVYHVKGRSFAINNMNYVVVIKKVEKDPNAKPLSVPQVEQMFKLMRDTHYISMTGTNYIRTYNDKLIFIDTESTYDRSKYLSKGLMRLISSYHDINKDFSSDALKYILTEMASQLTRYGGQEREALYNQIKGHLRRFAPHKTWNYVLYFDELVGKRKVADSRTLALHKSMQMMKERIKTNS